MIQFCGSSPGSQFAKMGLLYFDGGAWGACFVLPMPWSNRRLGSGRPSSPPRTGCADPGAAGSAAILSLRWWMYFSQARRRAGAPQRVDADQRKQCAAERAEAYAAFRLAMTCLKSVTNST